MSNIDKKMSFPLDEDKFFRRACPLCNKEFKILLSHEELTELTQKGIDSYMLSQQENDKPSDEEKNSNGGEYFCPYCGQKSENWWTEEQQAYINVVAENIVADLMNENIIKPMKRSFGSGGIIQFKGKEMQHKEPWISPEDNDMKKFELPCCQRQIKIEENWENDVFCYFCGFPYRI